MWESLGLGLVSGGWLGRAPWDALQCLGCCWRLKGARWNLVSGARAWHATADLRDVTWLDFPFKIQYESEEVWVRVFGIQHL